jgi:methionyl-tRNA formyltransferase
MSKKTVFFGTPDISVYFLEKLKNLDFNFDLIITNPDKPSGRKKILTPPAVKI